MSFYLYYSFIGELHLRLGRKIEAAHHFELAIDVCQSEPEKLLLNSKLNELLN